MDFTLEAWWMTWEKVRFTPSSTSPSEIHPADLFFPVRENNALPVYHTALSSCAHVKELIRTKQGQFTLEEHALHEEQWTLEHVLRSLQPCSEPKPPGANT